MKKEITFEIRRMINIKNTKETFLLYHGKQIGLETNDGREYSILLKNSFSLKTIEPKLFPPNLIFFKEGK